MIIFKENYFSFVRSNVKIGIVFIVRGMCILYIVELFFCYVVFIVNILKGSNF